MLGEAEISEKGRESNLDEQLIIVTREKQIGEKQKFLMEGRGISMKLQRKGKKKQKFAMEDSNL